MTVVINNIIIITAEGTQNELQLACSGDFGAQDN